MLLRKQNQLIIRLTDSLLDDDLSTPPPGLRHHRLDGDTLLQQSLHEPKTFTTISRTLSAWPIVTIQDAVAVINYLSEGRRISVVDPGRGILRDLAVKFQQVLGLHRRFAIPFNSGTNALNAAYRALGLKRGDPVAVVGYTFHATVTPVIELGANPIMMDASPRDGNVTLEIIRNVIERHPDIRIVAVNHNWGVPIREIRQIKAYLADRQVQLIEDCSHAHGATVEGLPVGSFGDVAVFSLQANKNVTGGEGGMCLSDDPEINTKILLVGHESASEATCGMSIDPSLRETGLHGLQFRINPMAAALVISQLDRLNEVIKNRRENFEYLCEKIQDVPSLKFTPIPPYVTSCYYRLRAEYLPEHNRGVSLEDYVRSLRRYGLDVHIDNSGPLARKAIYQRHFAEYGSQALVGRQFYRAEDFPGILEYTSSRIVFPVFSRALGTVKGVLDTMAQHITSLSCNV